ncbi:hypothetical protein KQI84_06290 [bacterium]|nr:hypothetical protein [bacterium]
MASEPTTSPQHTAHLLNQIRWVTRISVALSSAIHIEDVYSVLLSGLISPLGLGYSHALVFEVDDLGEHIIGKFAIGFKSNKEAATLRRELEEESQFLEQRRRQLVEEPDRDVSNEEELRTLEMGSHWVTVFQRLGPDNPETRLMETFRYPLRGASQDGEKPTLFELAANRRTPLAMRRDSDRASVPEEMAELLPEQFALVPLHTNKGLRALVLLDRRLGDPTIGRSDIEALEWFTTQAALALQNAELITDLENAYQELKTVDQLKSNFLSIVSHELRTPLTAITGFVELVLAQRVGDINESQRSLLTRVAKNTGHLNNMVNDLIEIAEIEAEGMTDVRLVPIDPLATFFNTIPKLEYRRRDRMVDIQPIFEGAVPRILCDERVLERIFFHLLDNAVKFSPPDESVRVEFKSTDDDRLAITIRDKGKGIPQDKLRRIFDQFYQIEGTLTRSHEGLGLGLSVTRMLIQSTRGEIDVNSQVGQGSAFTVIYPVA